MSRKKKSLHHATTAVVIETQGEIVDADVKNHDLLETASRAKAVFNVKIVDRVKSVGLVKSGLHENQRAETVLLAALLRAIAVKAQRLPVTAVTHEYLGLLQSSQISRHGKKRSVLCR
jgi:hypothetical protein